MWILLLAVLLQDGTSRQAEFKVFDAETRELLCHMKSRTVEPLGNGRLRIAGPDATIYTRDREKNLHTMHLKADTADYHEKTRLLKLEGNVRLHSEEGDSFLADRATVNFATERVRTEDPFRLAKPDMEILGTGLDSRLDLTDCTIHREGRISLFGDPRKADTPKPDGEERRTLIRGEGPITIREQTKQGKVTTEIETRDNATMIREDAAGLVTTTSKVLRITGSRPEPGGELAVDRILLRGRVRLRDSQDGSADARRIEIKGDLTDLHEKVHVRFTDADLFGDHVHMDRASGTAVARGHARMNVRGEEPTDISATTVHLTLTRQGGWNVRTIDAVGEARVKRAGADIDSHRFLWDKPRERGTVIGRPVATVEREGVRIRGPLLGLRGRTLAVIGPKAFEFERQGKRYHGTARGEARFLDRVIHLGRDAILFGPDMTLTGDRMTIVQGETEEPERILVEGTARLRGSTDSGIRSAFGRRVQIEGALFTIDGGPLARLELTDRTVVGDRVVFNRDTGRFRASGRPGRMQGLR